MASTSALVGGTAYAYQSSLIEITREQLVLPELRKGLRVVAISDVHAPSFCGFIENLITSINQTSPDIFILAGDTVDRQANESWVRVFGKVEARLAKLAMLGNWEYCGHLDLVRLKKEYEKAGFSLLVNKAVNISGLLVIGLDDFLHGSPDYRIFQYPTTTISHLLAVSHCPESFDTISAFSPNPVITISGHTHGGQIAPFGIVLWTPRGSGSYVKGWYHKGNHSLYVMRGIGTSGIPLRIGARPELLVLDLIPKKA